MFTCCRALLISGCTRLPMRITLQDVTGRTLPGDYHINLIKRAKEVTPDGLADTYEQLRNQLGLPNDACALPLKSSAAQL